MKYKTIRVNIKNYKELCKLRGELTIKREKLCSLNDVLEEILGDA